MTRAKIIKEELYICIYIPHTWGYDQMGGYDVPKKIFYDEPFTTDKTAELYLALAKKQHKKNHIALLQKSQFWKSIGKYCQRK